jgi:hypothetical protein
MTMWNPLLWFAIVGWVLAGGTYIVQKVKRGQQWQMAYDQGVGRLGPSAHLPQENAVARKKRPEWQPGLPFVEGVVELIEVPPGKRDVIVWDAALPGFGIRRFASGRASYIVQFNFGHLTRRQSLGPVVDGNLKDQRKWASEVLAKRRLGTDVVAVGRCRADRARMRGAVASATHGSRMGRRLLPLYPL